MQGATLNPMTSVRPLCSLANPDHPLVADAPRSCSHCKELLCLRKQVVNLALGFTDSMLCLRCHAKENEQLPEEVLENIKDYVLSRECFAKEWVRYTGKEFCPDATGCLPDECFK